MIGLLGFGTVGQGVVEVLRHHPDPALTIKKILVRERNKERKILLQEEALVTNPQAILDDPDITTILECTGDDRAYEWMKAAFSAGKHVITANKKVVSEHFEELSKLAAKNQVYFLYESAVGAGIPLLKPLKEQLQWNSINLVEGILNGTCNFILSEMKYGSYEKALKEAQNLGYAEADPTADVGGFDTMRKLRIFASLAFQGTVQEDDILTIGIDKLDKKDLVFFHGMGYEVRLLAKAIKKGHTFTAQVMPTAFLATHPMAPIQGSENRAGFVGNFIGPLYFKGFGAGMFPTASGMLNDAKDAVYGRLDQANPLGEEILYPEAPWGQVYFRFHGESVSPWKKLIKEPYGPGFLSKEVNLREFQDFPGAVILVKHAELD